MDGDSKTRNGACGPRGRSLRDLLAYSDDQMAIFDPLEMNLLVAKEISGLEGLDIAAYKQTADKWATDIKRGLREAEKQFHATPWDWKNDIHFFRLGYLCWFVDTQLGIRYREDQKDAVDVTYNDPSDLFLHGVMDTRRGTCANMAALHVALGWRMRWPVSLACVHSHLICRYDDGKSAYNIEATKTGGPGFHSHPDQDYLKNHRLPNRAVECTSDLRRLKPREMLGIFLGLRGRFYQDTDRPFLAEPDYLLARYLFPVNRYLHFVQGMATIQTGMHLFEPNEPGHPVEVLAWLRELVRSAPWESRDSLPKPEFFNSGTRNEEYHYDLSGKVEH